MVRVSSEYKRGRAVRSADAGQMPRAAQDVGQALILWQTRPVQGPRRRRLAACDFKLAFFDFKLALCESRKARL